MMTTPPNQSQSGYSFAETFEQLVLLRQSLLELLRKSGGPVKQNPVHSLFSSKRNYRTDELSAGLSTAIAPFVFSVN